MELLSFLKIAAKSNTATYTKFLQQYSIQGNTIHVFHEGKDDPSFYGNFIDQFIKRKQKVYYHHSANKDGVYDNYRKIDWTSFNKKRVLFLVDKDYSDVLRISYPIDVNIFVTKFYSIENYLVSKAMFSRCLRDLVALSDERITQLLSKAFNDSTKEFYKASLFLTAYILLHKMRKSKINLQNITLSDVFEITDDFKIKKKIGVIEKLDKICGVITGSCYQELRRVIKQLQQINQPKKYIRGKFEIMYFVKCFTNVPELLNKGKKRGEKRFKCGVNLSSSTAMQLLGPRLKQPQDIKAFFAKNLR